MKHDDVIGKDSLPPSRPIAELLIAGGRIEDLKAKAATTEAELVRLRKALRWALAGLNDPLNGAPTDDPVVLVFRERFEEACLALAGA